MNETARRAADEFSTLAWSNSFHALGPRFYTELAAQGLPQPHWVAASERCGEMLGLPSGWSHDEHMLQVFSGNALLPGMQPLASVYSGHQFGVWAGQLGDGRALWLGELSTPSGPQELQLKGSGRTPYSRMGDGRAVLRSSIREFLCSQALHALGIPTTGALCITGSPLPVRRENIETAAIVTRVAPSFLRFGHFEHFAHTAADDNHAALRCLADHVIAQFYPECAGADHPYAALLRAVALRTARLIAQWQAVGFCHGVMNTDNMSMLGLTIDYGPFGFLDAFDPGHICNHSDTHGRYAYGRQPDVGLWNLYALATALMPLVGDKDEAFDAVDAYREAFTREMSQCVRAKLGLRAQHDNDGTVIDGWFTRLAADRVDFSIAFRRLATFGTMADANNDAVRDLFIDREAFDAWALQYRERLRAEQSDDAARAHAMNRVNPKYVLRNHLAESAIRAAHESDFEPTQRLLRILEQPFDEQPQHEVYADFPPDWAQHLEVSCSS